MLMDCDASIDVVSDRKTYERQFAELSKLKSVRVYLERWAVGIAIGFAFDGMGRQILIG